MTRPFRFGLQSYAAPSAQNWRDQARHAEASGFSTFSVADHVIGPGPALSAGHHPVQNLAAVPAMAVAMEATSTIRIGSRVFCVDYRQPVVFAKELATLDFFSEGRLELGLGAGWLQSEYEAMGVQWDRPGVRLDRFEETLTLIRAHFGEGEVDVHGDYVNASGFECVPITKMMQRLEGNPDEFTVDAVLVALDCLIRRGYFTSERHDYLEIIHALRP